ncbi:MAG TPA: virulence RhuM family protein [Candidatus Limnocylindria bacterium]|jgi:hypothetical protein|nr:virulence RhuM family protein [Candidatus Limnocylindria bacterium]
MPIPPGGELLLYQAEDGQTRLQCRFEEQTLWLSQAAMVDLYQTTKANISIHLKNIFEEGELREESVVKPYLTTAADGKSYRVQHYRLEAVLAVGYRVRSPRGTQFRQWATARLEEYLRKGFTMDDERLKNPPGHGVPDYFDELLERIRDIRASEQRMYLQLRNILALAADYDSTAGTAQEFFQTVQNKLHFAVTGRTAPELISDRSDANKPNMGLTAWKGAVDRKADVTVAKNYLNDTEISELNRVVVMFLDYAEDRARRRKQIFLNDWRTKLDEFLRFNERGVLPGMGSITREQADRMAHERYNEFEARRRTATELAAEAELTKQLQSTARNVPPRKK